MITQERYRTTVKELLANGSIKMAIGYRLGSTPDRRRPLFIRTSEEADQLVLDSTCMTNLSGYLVTEGLLSDEKKVGIFLRPEGIRSINILAAEYQLNADQIVIFGFDSTGRDVRPLDGRNVGEFSKLLNEIKEHPLQIVKEPLHWRIEKMNAKERFDFWQEEFSRCIKCYACRQVCPFCFCEQCLCDRNKPQMVETTPRPAGNTAWHIVRAMHLAGRCAGCAECERVCPMDIPLNLLNRKMAKELKELYDHEAGFEVNDKGPLATFTDKDDQSFIK